MVQNGSLSRRIASSVLLTIALGLISLSAADAKGTVFYKSKTKDITVVLKFAYLVKGPDPMYPKGPIRRLVLSTTDIGATVQACETMSCLGNDFKEGLQLDFDGGARLNYWMVLNNQLVQYSGALDPEVFTVTADSATRLAGKLVFDKTTAGGPKVTVEFDAPLLKTFTKAR